MCMVVYFHNQSITHYEKGEAKDWQSNIKEVTVLMFIHIAHMTRQIKVVWYIRSLDSRDNVWVGVSVRSIDKCLNIDYV